MSNRIRNGVIVMTALPPTQGHAALIEFAGTFLRTMNDDRYTCGQLVAIVNQRSCEPACGSINRAWPLTQEMHRRNVGYNIQVVDDRTDGAPQTPSDHPDFWNWWKDHINRIVSNTWQYESGVATSLQPGDFLFASEEYGQQLADVMGLVFVPFDMKREIVQSRATNVRTDMLNNWDSLLIEQQYKYRKKVTIFGAESCGKSTMANRLASEFVGTNGQPLVTSIPEWARLYLETVGSEVTEEKMDIIMRGQFALQKMHRVPRTPFLVQDTDLLSTIGYYHIMGINPPDEIEQLAFESGCSSHLYVVMNSNIPFEQDPLRYGGDKRESSDDFWIGLLQKYELPYHVVMATDPDLQFTEVSNVLTNLFNDSTRDLKSFIRT